jgi:hypothetical protein
MVEKMAENVEKMVENVQNFVFGLGCHLCA